MHYNIAAVIKKAETQNGMTASTYKYNDHCSVSLAQLVRHCIIYTGGRGSIQS
jgi:hypothetical protein